MATLSLRARIAQLVMPWMPGAYTAADDPAFEPVLAWVDSLGVGGILVSAGSPLEMAARLNTLQGRAKVPLLVASDLEAGTMLRLLGGTPFPSNMGVAATGKERDAYEMGRITAREGRAVGIHLALAPVADVNSNPLNPIINTRSFGEDPHTVGRLVAAEVRGMQDHGMLATAKHFPGHGDTDVDSHLALPRLDASWRRLDSLELVPFRSAVGADVAAIMSAHMALPAIDPTGRPATLAPPVLGGVLRDSLRFRGVIVTDALNMGSIVDTYGFGEAAVLALEAGADLLLQPADPAVTIDAVESAVRSSRLSEERINRSARRILELKRRAGVFRQRLVDLDRVMLEVGNAASVDTARSIAARSVVLVDDRGGAIDRLRAGRGRRALILFGDDANVGAGARLAAELWARGDTLAVFRLSPASGPASYDSARAMAARAPLVIVAAAIRASASRGTITLPTALANLIDSTALHMPMVLVSLGSPYIRAQTPAVGSYLIGWAANPTTEWAVAGALTGAAISGRLPVRIPPSTPLGAGLDRPGLPAPAEGNR
jgi:beta-N-acetylhexosaminidase